MIVYAKLAKLLKERNMTWEDLGKADISPEILTMFSHNRSVNADIIDKVCEYLKVQPCDIMEWIPDSEYKTINVENYVIKQSTTEKKTQKNKKIIKSIAVILISVITGALLWNLWIIPSIIQPSRSYREAERLLEEGYYSEAATLFENLGNYKDSQKRVEEVVTCMKDEAYEYGIQLIQNGEYESAIEQFEALGNYRDAFLKIDEVNTLLYERKYNTAKYYFDEEFFEKAKDIFEELGTYKDSVKYYNQCIELISDEVNCDEVNCDEVNYDKAVSLYNKGYYSNAYMIFVNMDDYKDCKNYAQLCTNKFSEIDKHNVLMLFPMIDYEISLESLCNILGSDKYSKGRSYYTNGIMYRHYEFNDNYVLNGIPAEITFRFKWENKASWNNENSGVLEAMSWHCPEEIANYSKYLELKQYITDILGVPTEESTGEKNQLGMYSCYTYWNDMQLSYSNMVGNNITFGRSVVWSDK